MTKPKTAESANERVAELNQEYTRWLRVLDKYHQFRFNENYQQYTAYNSTIGTSSNISDPIAPELVERVIQKMFERDASVLAMAKNKKIPPQIANVISAAVKYYWDAAERIRCSGTMRSKLKVFGREFCIIGNLATETYYDAEYETPDIRLIPIEDIIFDPTKSLKTSKRHYIKQYISPDELEALAEKKQGDQVVSGIFDAKIVEKCLARHKEEVLLQDPTSAKVNRSGDDLYEKSVNGIELTTLWEGKHCIRILDWLDIVHEYDNEILGSSPLDFAMDIEVPKQPYAFSFLDFIKPLCHAKDLLLNQIVDYGSKVLNPPIFVDPSLGAIYKKTLANAWKLSGVVYANPQQVDFKTMPDLPKSGFELMSYIQQRAESTSQLGGYMSGMTHAKGDKTHGTKGGIQALIEQGSSPINDRQQNIEESIIEPMINKWLKYLAEFMAKDEIKYVLMTGENNQWVGITKSLLQGKIKLQDLMISGIMSTDDVTQMKQKMIEEGKNPDKDLLFDVEWIVKVETGSMALQDQQKDLEMFDGWVAFGAQLGVQFDTKKLVIERANRSNIKNPEAYFSADQSAMPLSTGAQPGLPAGTPPTAGQSQAPTPQPTASSPAPPVQPQPALAGAGIMPGGTNG
jgi:hypothetical protein